MNFEELVNSLNDEQKNALMAAFGVDPSVVKPKPKIEVKELPTLQSKEEVVSSKPRRKVNEDFTVVRDQSVLDKRKIPVKAKKNQWMDTGEDRDPDFDPVKFERMGKSARNREKVKKQTVECHVCGRDFQINPGLVYGEYVRCNRCTGK